MIPAGAPRPGGSGHRPLLEVRGLRKVFTSQGLLTPKRQVVAVSDVSFRVSRGEAVALVGESGSGKSTIARLLLRLDRPDDGDIRLDAESVLEREPRRASLAYRGRVQMVFQDPFGSLNPVHTVAHHLIRPLLRHGTGDSVGALNPARSVDHHVKRPLARHGSAGTQLATRVLELLRTVGLEPAEDFVNRHPYELSGGQRQRVAIARALAAEPDVLVADEPTSMLDVSIRMGILNLLGRLKRERGLALLLITHDLAAARYLADRVLVLYRGRIVEEGPSDSLVDDPRHPYTRLLLSAIADVDHPLGEEPAETEAGSAAPAAGVATVAAHSGGAPSAAAAPTACPFAERCSDVLDRCRSADPEPRTVGDHQVRCHLYPTGGETT